jgi:hypothetical protein
MGRREAARAAPYRGVARRVEAPAKETAEMNEKHVLREGQILTGALFSEPMRVETVRPMGPDAWLVGLVGTRSERYRKVSLRSRDLESLAILDASHTYDGDGRLLRLGLQAIGRAQEAVARGEQGADGSLADALSALGPKGREEKRLLDAMPPAVPR